MEIKDLRKKNKNESLAACGEGGLIKARRVCGGVGATTSKEYEEIITVILLAVNLKST